MQSTLTSTFTVKKTRFQKLRITWNDFHKSIENLRYFNLLLILEWIDSASDLFKHTLGWELYHDQVLPHELQAKRGGIGGNKASLSARNFLSTNVCL